MLTDLDEVSWRHLLNRTSNHGNLIGSKKQVFSEVTWNFDESHFTNNLVLLYVQCTHVLSSIWLVRLIMFIICCSVS